jgi:DNA (cytosine-5)-methyltransferase 1
MLTVGSLFAGIGGLDLGLERAGMRVRWQVENNPHCIRVLAKHWPTVKRYGDIKQIKWSEVEPVDLICGGFPCQPVSVAGSRKGDEDERWLWPEFLRAICEVRPRYALVENVPGLLSTDNGRLARGVFGDLAEIGYDAEWNIVSAADVGAPHRRQRIFIVAYTKSQRALGRFGVSGNAPISGGRGKDDGRGVPSDFPEEIVADSSEQGLQRFAAIMDRTPRIEGALGRGSCTLSNSESNLRRTFGDEGPIALDGGGSNFGDNWAVEPDVGRVADGVPSRVDRLKCLGNAVVPQVAEFIGKAIIEAEGVTQ